MSILKKAYEITTWDDVWDTATKKFVEQRRSIIGTDTMESPNRALTPKLTRNVNGTKKLTFKMYRYYIDAYDGEKKENPFIDELVSERKVKLHYKDKWYDFIVKNISENSSDYSYTYQLEDALVQELSKNGFGVTLDEKIKEPKNIGTVQELATNVLNGTDWTVESEVFVQKVEEALVYIKIPANTTVRKIQDQTSLTSGISDTEQKFETETIALAFYSSCTGRPHRFQFIVLPSYEKEDVKINDKRVIEMANCQYYYDVPTPKTGYEQSELIPSMYLPTGWAIIDKGAESVGAEYDTTVSYWYRGNRYGFAQKTEFVPLLEKYCQLYTKNDETYYGYQDIEYMSPVFVQDTIVNKEFKGTSGWVGTFIQSNGENKKDYATKITDVYGYFNPNKTKQDQDGNWVEASDKFVSATTDMLGGVEVDLDRYTSYLKVEVPKAGQSTPIVLNTGFWDLRVSTKTIDPGEKWVLRAKIVDCDGNVVVDTDQDRVGHIGFQVAEIQYDKSSEGYIINNEEACKTLGIEKLTGENGQPNTHGEYCFTFQHQTPISEEEFRKKELKLIITFPKTVGTYYIQKMELFRAVEHETTNKENEKETKFISPGTIDENGILQTKFKLFKSSELDTVTDIKQINFYTLDLIDYNEYKPSYNNGAQKVRAVTAKESNYFNILQSIAETFECWMSLEITRAEANEDGWQEGAIKSKKVCFKNYAGNDNHASFQYGVNLKDIQRTFASKNIVTKLIVKQNNNQYAPNGFCTIARANSNPTGENYIYDFQYYFDKGLLNADDFYSLVYAPMLPKWKITGCCVDEQDEDKKRGAKVKIEYYLNGEKKYREWEEELDRTGKSIYIAADDKPNILWVQREFPDLIESPYHYVDFLSGGAQDNYWGHIASADSKYTVFKFTITKDENTDVVVCPENSLFGYYSYIKELNNQLKPIAETLANKQLALIKLQAEKEVEEGLLSAADDGLEETAEEFLQLFDTSIQEIDKFNSETIRLDGAVNNTNYALQIWDNEGRTRGSAINYEIYRINWPSNETASEQTPSWEKTPNIDWHNLGAMPNATVVDGVYNIKWTSTTGPHCGLRVALQNEDGSIKNYAPGKQYRLSYTLTPKESGTLTIAGHTQSFKDVRLIINGVRYSGNSKAINVTADTAVNVIVEGTCYYNRTDAETNKTNYLYIQPNKAQAGSVDCLISNIKLYENGEAEAVTYTLQPQTLNGTTWEDSGEEVTFTMNVSGYKANEYIGEIIDESNQKVVSLVEEYLEYERQYAASLEKLGAETEEQALNSGVTDGIYYSINSTESEIANLQTQNETLLSKKSELNKLFFSVYSRFIQEGTWMSEDYTDDEKYFIDAQSTMYNSCYPQVQYTINVLELSALPGYEMFEFELGDKTHVVDPQFFGTDLQEEIVITELVEELDDPTKNSIKVQNFKNQFQDLFQKITASVQQTQYSTGSYEKAVALAEADAKSKGQFLNEALTAGMDKLSFAGQTTVEQGANGITLTDSNTQDQMRLIGGAIMMSRQDENGLRKWSTGLTPEGISASLVTAGTLNAANIAIMNVNEPVFRWDAFGLTAFNAEWTNQGVIGNTDYTKFVRFDKCGIYGMKDKDGRTWKPLGSNPYDNVMNDATFALTWEGLKVTGNDGVVARIGKYDNYVINITKKTESGTDSLLSFSNSGTLQVGGWQVSPDGLYSPSGPGAMRSTTNPYAYLSSIGKKEDIEPWTGKKEEVCMTLKAGSDFMVSKNGTLYAKAGYIGNMEIGDIASKTQPINENLLAGTAIPDETILNYTSGEAYQPTWHEHNGKNFKYHAYNIYHLIDNNNIPSLFEVNDLITISFQWSFIQDATASDNSVYPFFVIECGNGSSNPLIPWSWGELVNTNGDRWEVDDLKARFSISEEQTSGFAWATIKITESTHKDVLKSLRIRVDGPEGKSTDKLIISNAKLERGNVFTAWSEAIGESTVSSNVNTGNFSWKFSPTEGLLMWNGAQGSGESGTNEDGTYKDNNLVFKVDKDKLYMRGHVEAQSGNIAQWNITTNGIASKHTDSNNRTFETVFSCPTWLDDGDGKNLPSQAGGGDASDVLVVKYQETENGPWKYPFYIRSSGYVKCDNLHANGGKIGEWTLKDGTLSYSASGSDGILGPNGEHVVNKIMRIGAKMCELYSHTQWGSSASAEVYIARIINGEILSYQSETTRGFYGGLYGGKLRMMWNTEYSEKGDAAFVAPIPLQETAINGSGIYFYGPRKSYKQWNETRYYRNYFSFETDTNIVENFALKRVMYEFDESQNKLQEQITSIKLSTLFTLPTLSALLSGGLTGWIRFPIDGGINWVWRSALFKNGILSEIREGRIEKETDGYRVLV